MRVSYLFLTVQERVRLLGEEAYMWQQQEAGNSTMSSLPKEWEEKTNYQLRVKWDEVQRKHSKSQQKESGYEESLFMFEDGIVPFPSHFDLAKYDSNYSLSFFLCEDILVEVQKKRLMQCVHVLANHVMYAPSHRDSKRLPVFKDIAPN